MKISQKIPPFIYNLNVKSVSRLKNRFKGDDIFKFVSAIFASSIFLLLGLMVYELVKGSWLSMQIFGLNFITGTEWDPAISKVFGPCR